MRFCPTFCPLPKENFIESSLNRDALGSRFVAYEEHFALFHNGANHGI